jgi:hypothetical protein
VPNAKNLPFGRFLNNPAPCYFPLTSIIAAAGLNGGVRDGNQWIPRAKSTGVANRERARTWYEVIRSATSVLLEEPEVSTTQWAWH